MKTVVSPVFFSPLKYFRKNHNGEVVITKNENKNDDDKNKKQ
jgi:hypothetical protein